MKSTLIFLFLIFNIATFSQVTKEIDQFNKNQIAFNDKNYTLLGKMSSTIQIVRTERLQKDTNEVSYRIYIKVWLGSSFCLNEQGGIVLLMEDGNKILLNEKSLNCSKIKCGGGQCNYYVNFAPRLTPKEFFMSKNKSIKMIRINTTEGYLDFEVDSERYRTNLSRMIETFSEFEQQDSLVGQ